MGGGCLLVFSAVQVQGLDCLQLKGKTKGFSARQP